MFDQPKEFLSTKSILVFLPRAPAADQSLDRTVLQSRRAHSGTRFRLQGDDLLCWIGDGWQSARLTVALDVSDPYRLSDREVLKDLVAAGSLSPVSTTAAGLGVSGPERSGASDHPTSVRDEVSEEFGMLVAESEEFRYAAEDSGLRVIARDVGPERAVSLTVLTREDEEILRIDCDTSFGRWSIATHGALACALAAPEVLDMAEHSEEVIFDVLPSELGAVFATLSEALPDLWSGLRKERPQSMAL